MARFSLSQLCLNLILRSTVFFAILIPTGNAELTIGTEFLFAFPCSDLSITPSLLVVNSNANQTKITIYSSTPGFTTMQRTVAGNSGTPIFFPDYAVVQNMRVCDANKVKRQGFTVEALMPIALYMYLADDNGKNAVQMLVLPYKMLGTHYVANNTAGCADNSSPIHSIHYSGIIVAKQSNTRVTVGNTTVYLNEMDIYYTCMAISISSSANIAYLLASNNSAVMALPTTYTFKTYYVSPIYHPLFEYQIWAFENNTQVSVNGRSNVTVNAGQYYPAVIDGNGGFVVASKPVQTFFAYGDDYVSDFVTVSLGNAYAPEMFLSTNVQFYSFGIDSYPVTLRVIVPLASTGNIFIDGQAIPALQYRRIPLTQIYIAERTILGPAMLHTISTNSSSDRYMAQVLNQIVGIMPGITTYAGYTIAMNLTGNA